MGMIFIIHLSLSPFWFFLGSFCFLHFRHKTWMYNTIRFYQGFTIFNHYILSVGLCLCVRASVCMRVSACMCVCPPKCMSVFASECVYVCMCAIKIADTVLFILFYFHYRSPVSYH